MFARGSLVVTHQRSKSFFLVLRECGRWRHDERCSSLACPSQRGQLKREGLAAARWQTDDCSGPWRNEERRLDRSTLSRRHIRCKTCMLGDQGIACDAPILSSILFPNSRFDHVGSPLVKPRRVPRPWANKVVALPSDSGITTDADHSPSFGQPAPFGTRSSNSAASARLASSLVGRAPQGHPYQSLRVAS